MNFHEKREYKISAYDVENKQNKEITKTIPCEDSLDGHFKAIGEVGKENPTWINIAEISNRLIDLV